MNILNEKGTIDIFN